MPLRPSPPDEHASPTWLVIGMGILALGAAMGIGRFVFTPLLPLMLRDGTVGTHAGTTWAAANYVGYLVGAATVRWPGRKPASGLRWSLLGIALTTLAFASDAVLPAGVVLRALSGIFSAWALICATSVILTELGRRQMSHRGAWIYVGVGLGITLSGTLTWLGGMQPARWLWLELGAVAAAAGIAVTLGLGRLGQAAPLAAQPAATPSRGSNVLPLVLCYGVSGFGYIVPATFLPALARQQVSNPLVFGLAWPLFGLAALLSVAASARWLAGWPRKRVWASAQGIMALGTALPVATQALWSLCVSAVLVGGTFMVATMAGLQLAREVNPNDPTPLLARMTMAFAAGQIVGPLLVRLLGSGIAAWDAVTCANAIATALLALTAAWLWRGDCPATRR